MLANIPNSAKATTIEFNKDYLVTGKCFYTRLALLIKITVYDKNKKNLPAKITQMLSNLREAKVKNCPKKVKPFPKLKKN